MEERIYNIISNAIKDSRIITKEEITEIVDLFTKINNLEEYVKGISFMPEGECVETNPHYRLDKRIVYYFYDDILKEISDHSENSINFHILKSIFHELTHAKQYKKYYELLPKEEVENGDKIKVNTPEEYLLLSSFGFSILYPQRMKMYERRLKKLDGEDVKEKYNNYYQLNHDFYPIERFADLDAIFYLKKILFKYETDDFYIRQYHDIILRYLSLYLFVGYKFEKNKLKAPTLEIFKDLGDIVDKTSIKLIQHELDKESIPAFKKLYLGLDIDIDTFIKLQDYYNKISDMPYYDDEPEDQKQLTKHQ